MISLQVYNSKGEPAGEMEFPKVLEAGWKPALVQQVALAMMANKRKPVAHAKGRGEVRGGGKKPWAQKGTGRARQGSIRSPLWKGGGAAFGPNKEKNYSQKINKKMARQALLSVLTKKAKDGEVKVVDSFDVASRKTKNISAALNKVSAGRSKILVAPFAYKNFYLAARNLAKTKIMPMENLNVSDLLNFREVLIDKKSLEYGK